MQNRPNKDLPFITVAAGCYDVGGLCVCSHVGNVTLCLRIIVSSVEQKVARAHDTLIVKDVVTKIVPGLG